MYMYVVIPPHTHTYSISFCSWHSHSRTPLDLAVSSENVNAVKYLLNYGAGLNTLNRWQYDIQQVADEVNAGSEIRIMLGLNPIQLNRKYLNKFQSKKFHNQNNSFIDKRDEEEKDLLSDLAALAGEI